MKLHYRMTAQDWKDLLNYLTSQGCKLVYFPETDNNFLFLDFKYVLVEYDEMFFYMDASPWDFSVCKYNKISPYEKQQSGYSHVVHSAEDLIEYIKTQTKCRPVSGTHKQRIFLTELYDMKDGHTRLWHLENKLAGWREKNILSGLSNISMVRHTYDYCVLRFQSANGDWFDYETKSHRITG